ncbi:MAG TPA: VOC family protein, partial [Kofleriaceae bacterium]|nr:VOC family protein [Kofleriaceae bacterium]
MALVEGGRTTHTTLEARDIAQSLRFYRDVMGLRVHQPTAGFGHVMDSRGLYAAVLHRAKPSPQPFLNFYARPVAEPADVDVAHGKIAAVRDAYQIA